MGNQRSNEMGKIEEEILVLREISIVSARLADSLYLLLDRWRKEGESNGKEESWSFKE